MLSPRYTSKGTAMTSIREKKKKKKQAEMNIAHVDVF